VFFSLMTPSRWSLFNPTIEMVGRLGMVGSGNQLLSVPSDLTTFSFKFPVHPIPNFRREDGTTGFVSVLCPVAFNDYLMKVHGYGALFDHPRCPYCEKSAEAWKTHNQRWEDLGYDQERKKGLGKDEYRRILDNDPVLKKSRQHARQFSTQDRYLVQVWDHSKFCGERPMDEGQENLQFQLWLAPKTVHDTLNMLYSDGSDFFDPSSELGVPMIKVTKDTSRCSGTDFSQTKYTLFPGKVEKYPSDWVSYLDNEEAWPDPTGAMITLASYEDLRRTLLDGDNSGGDDAPRVNRGPAPQPAPQAFAPPTAPPQPQVAPAAPVAPPVPKAAPIAEDVEEAPRRAPTPPSAPIPSAPPSATPPPGFGGVPLAPGMSPERKPVPGKRHNW